jgi:hypothetical protein
MRTAAAPLARLVRSVTLPTRRNSRPASTPRLVRGTELGFLISSRRAYISCPAEQWLPPEVAKAFVKDMRAMPSPTPSSAMRSPAGRWAPSGNTASA